jgi:flagellar motor switch protein FliN/FliY
MAQAVAQLYHTQDEQSDLYITLQMRSHIFDQSSMPNNVNVQSAQFNPFNAAVAMNNSDVENIDLIMDVPLEVTVELGRTNKSISEILEFKPGTIVELNKVAGDPIDILVNGKLVAIGEVVVIDENFGIRIVDIIK